MHPNPSYRNKDREVQEALIDRIGFGTIFVQTPDGPRAAQTPMLSDGNGHIRFHLARANALSRHLDGTTALITINGPDSYISPRWYESRATVPTWNFVTLELEGRVRQMSRESLEHMLVAIGEQHEARIETGEPWTRADTPPDKWERLLGAITGFEMEVSDWRPTFKLSQDETETTRDQVIAALEALDKPGASALAAMMQKAGR